MHPTPQTLWLWLLCFRILNAAMLRTYFNPDEQWQSLEVAHFWVFGFGHFTWEWEPCVAIRGVLHPGIFAAYYAALRLLQLDNAWLVAYGPRYLQGAAAAYADLAVHRCARGLLGADTALWALVVQLGNWFLFYCIPRTYSNSLEAVMMAVALEAWMLRGSYSRWRALLLGSLCVALRPMSATFWIILVLYELLQILYNKATPFSSRLCRLGRELLIPGIITSIPVLAMSTKLDSLWYGHWVFVPWNFVRFNLFLDGGAFYGSHPWYWYATEGIGVTLGTFLPFTIAGIWLCVRDTATFRPLHGPLSATAASITMFSFASHKEYRFLLPFLPLASIVTAVGLEHAVRKWYWRPLRLGIAIVLPQLLAAFFFSRVHQRGPEAVMAHLRVRPPGPGGAFFLTPCHATPLHSYLHEDVPLDFLDCSPGRGNIRDRFFAAPLGLLRALFPAAMDTDGHKGSAWQGAVAAADVGGQPALECLAERFAVPARAALPAVFVVWGALLSREALVEGWLTGNGYTQEAEIWDGYWSEGPYGLETHPRFLIFRKTSDHL